jgi:small subunit ribosomal protein S9
MSLYSMPEPIKKSAPVKKSAKPAVTHAAPVAHAAHPGRYIEAVGRRKTAIARVRLSSGTGKVLVNGLEPKAYFTLPRLVSAAVSPLEDLKIKDTFDVSAHVSGGGIHAQSGAVRLGIARAIVMKNESWKPRLRALGFLTRDSRMVERKKYGLKKARRAPQWAKR